MYRLQLHELVHICINEKHAAKTSARIFILRRQMRQLLFGKNSLILHNWLLLSIKNVPSLLSFIHSQSSFSVLPTCLPVYLFTLFFYPPIQPTINYTLPQITLCLSVLILIFLKFSLLPKQTLTLILLVRSLSPVFTLIYLPNYCTPAPNSQQAGRQAGWSSGWWWWRKL